MPLARPTTGVVVVALFLLGMLGLFVNDDVVEHPVVKKARCQVIALHPEEMKSDAMQRLDPRKRIEICNKLASWERVDDVAFPSNASSTGTDSISLSAPSTGGGDGVAASGETTTSLMPTSAASTSSNSGEKTVRFVPFPHNSFVGYGPDAGCDWMALPSPSAVPSSSSSANSLLVSSLLGGDRRRPDKIQQYALDESICVPRNADMRSKLHLFSTEEARQCLRDVTLVVAGDSYTKQLFIGLGEVLLGQPSRSELTNYNIREKIRREMEGKLRAFRDGDGRNLDVRWECVQECYGQLSPFANRCSQCVNGIRNNQTSSRTAFVVGATVHVYVKEHKSVNRTTEQLRQFIEATSGDGKGVIFMSGPSYS